MAQERTLRLREQGHSIGVFPVGPWNALTDVSGVRVGHVTLVRGADIRTGVTAILPHGRNLLRERVPAGVSVANGHGKMMGYTQIRELGEIETPIVLTNTLCVARAADAILDWTLSQPENQRATSINPVVGETNDGLLNAIEKRSVLPVHVRTCIERAEEGPIEEGCVGAGTGTTSFGWKAGIGTSSRLLPCRFGGYTLGVLVQSNFPGILRIAGVPIGRILDRYCFREDDDSAENGSIMIVIATDAPLSDRNLTRLSRRAFAGLARTGAMFTNGSGDYAIAFSTAPSVRRTAERRGAAPMEDLANEEVSALFGAAIEATEEAIYNSLFQARTTTGRDGHTVDALPKDRVLALLEEHGSAAPFGRALRDD